MASSNNPKMPIAPPRRKSSSGLKKEFMEKTSTLKANAAKLLHKFTSSDKKSKDKSKSSKSDNEASSSSQNVATRSGYESAFEEWTRAQRRGTLTSSDASSEFGSMDNFMRPGDPR